MRTAPSVIPPFSKKTFDDYTILDFDPLEIARQLCLIERRLLKFAPVIFTIARGNGSLKLALARSRFPNFMRYDGPKAKHLIS